MRRITAILLLLLLLPGLAMAQRLVPVSQTAEQQHAQAVAGQDVWLVPVWRSPDGHLMALLDRSQLIQAPLRMTLDENRDASRDVLSLEGDQMSSAGVSMRAGSRLYSSVRVSGMSRLSGRRSAVRRRHGLVTAQSSQRRPVVAGPGYRPFQLDGYSVTVGRIAESRHGQWQR